MPTPADLSAVSAAYQKAKGGSGQYTVTPENPGEWNGGARVGGTKATYVASTLFKSTSPTGARNILTANVDGKDFWYVADPVINGPSSAWGVASVPTGASGTAFFSEETWNKGADLHLGSTRGRLFDVDPIADGVKWKGGPSPSVIKDILTVLSPALIAIGGQALVAYGGAGASGGVGASEGVSITAGSGGIVAGETGFTLASSIPAYTAAQNAAGAAAAGSTTWGSAGGLAVTAGELAGGGAAVGGGVVAATAGTSSAQWGSAIAKTLGSVTSVASAIKATQGAIGSSGNDATTTAANPLGLADASGDYFGTVSDSQLAPFVATSLAGVPIWMWAALAVGAFVLLKKG